MKNRQRHVTVVVCTYNRAAELGETLQSLLGLRTDGRFTFDVLVVDNASTDGTQETIADLLRNATTEFSSVFEARPGVAAARNRGLAEAQGEWIAFCDDDQVADADWLIELLQMAEAKRVRIVGGAVQLALPEAAPQPALAVRRNFGESLGREPYRYSKCVSPGTGNLLIHRSVIDQVGSFDESLRQAGEDTDLFRRIREAGIDSWYNPRAVVWHRIPAYRLTDDYQRWSSQRTGWCFADRDRKESGLARLVVVAAARAAQAVLVRFPRLIWQVIRGERQESLGTRCDLWRCEGYLRFAVDAVAPRCCSQQAFRERIEFRNERSTFGAPSQAPAACLPEPATVAVVDRP